MGSSVVQKELLVARKSESLQELRVFARDILKNAKLSDYERGLVLLAIDEVITATLESSENGNGAMIHLYVEVSDVAVKVAVEDTQNYFQFGQLDDAHYESLRSSETRREIDILFLCQIMDEIYYSYHKGFENRVVMVKFLK